MLKREITYEDFNGNKVTDVVYFNLSKSELIELEAEHKGGFQEYILRIVEAKDNKTLFAEFKRIILMSYGVKSEDGKRFIKSDELREEFSQTAAFNELFMQLAMDENVAAAFINSLLPRDMVEQDKPVGPPKTGALAPPPPITNLSTEPKAY